MKLPTPDQAWWALIVFCLSILGVPLLFGGANLAARACYEIWKWVWP